MTDKQARFCEEYMIDLNATQAAIRAGYSPKTAREQAPRLLANVSIQNRIAQLQAEQSRRTGVSADRVVRELAKIAFANASDLIDRRLHPSSWMPRGTICRDPVHQGQELWRGRFGTRGQTCR